MKKLVLLIFVGLLINQNNLGQTEDEAEISISFRVYDNAGGEKTLHFGLDPIATDTIDFHFGESNLPPAPPVGAFDARWILPKNNFSGVLSSWLDYRYVPGFPFTDSLEHRLKYQASTGADTMFFEWDFPAEVTGRLQDLITGTLINLPISESGQYGITNFAVINQMKLMIYFDGILPVELVSFTASVQGKIVTLNWQTATETNNQGFQIERRKTRDEKSKEWEIIGFVNGNGTTTETKVYSFTDKNLTSDSYSYRLKQIDFDGTYSYSNEIEVETELPKEFSLEQNYPNPFNPNTKIKYIVPEETFVTIKVYDALGREVTTLINEVRQAGSHEIEFDAEELSSGIYFYKMETDSYTNTKKFMLMK